MKKKIVAFLIAGTMTLSLSACSGSSSSSSSDISDNVSSVVSSAVSSISDAVDEVTEAKGEDSQEAQVQTWKDGMYKVGSDIPAGEYVLIASASGYFQLSSDSTGSFESIIANDNFDTNTIVTISEGQYLTLTRCTAYGINDAPALDTSKEGMFKVGKDLAAGEYKIHSDSDGYVQVSSSSDHSFESIVSNDNFSGDSYITVSDGQYLTLTRANIVQ